MTLAATTPTHIYIQVSGRYATFAKIEVEHGQPAVFFRVSVPRREVLRPTVCWT